jgi:hypothetical protein
VVVRVAMAVTVVAARAAAVVDGGAQTVRAVEGYSSTVRRRMVAVAQCGGGG